MGSHITDDQLRTIFKALADARRLAIVRTLERDGEVCACNLLDGLGISQPTLSHHMKVLCDSGLVRCRKDSRWCYYSVDAAIAREVSAAFGLLADAADSAGDGASVSNGPCADGCADACERDAPCDCGCGGN